MTMEINEIGIRMRVRDGAQTSAGGSTDVGPTTEAGVAAKESINRDEIVDACVRRVLRALKTLQER